MTRTQTNVLVALAWVLSIGYAVFTTVTMLENAIIATCGVVK